MAEKKAKPAVIVPESDVVAQQAAQHLLNEYAAASDAEVPAEPKKIAKPKEWVCTKDTRISTPASGAMLIRRGQHVTVMSIVNALRIAGVELVAVA